MTTTSRPLRCLSVRQPFASALFGPKPGENRSWRPSWDVLRTGDWLAIHASVSRFTGAIRILADIDAHHMWDDRPPLTAMPRDAVLGVVRLAGVCRPYDAWRQGDEWANPDENFYWRFDDRRLFEVPIVPPPAAPMAHAGLWLAPGSVVAAARAVGVVSG